MARRSRIVVAMLLAVVAIFAAGCASSSEGDETTETTQEAPTTDNNEDEQEDEEETSEVEDDSSEPAVVPLEDEDQVTSAGEGSGADLTPQSGGEIIWALSTDGNGFDTTSSIGAGSIRVITALNDSLVSMDTEANWQPNLAESLTPNEDFTSWTIRMRPGLTFHDGEPVDGAAVQANMQAIKDSRTGSFALTSVEEISLVDDLSVRVDFSAPWATFPYMLVGQLGWMVSPSTIGTNETFVGTGPFMLEQWTPGDSARVVRNPNYWRDGLPYLDAINFKFLIEENVRRQAFDAGDVDGYLSPSADDIVEFLDDDETDVWIGTAGANEFSWVLNTREAPFDDVRVRRAVAHAIDQQFLIDTFRAGLTTPATGPMNPSNRWYSENNYPEFDPAAAQALVDEYEAEVGPIEFELTLEPTPELLAATDITLSFLEDVGIDVAIREIGPGQSVLTGISDDFQAIVSLGFGAPDPDGFYIFFHSSSALLNWSNLVSADIDEGLDRGRESLDEDERRAGYAQFLGALGDEVPLIWFDHLNGVEAVATIPQIHGIGVPGTLPDGTPQLPMTNGVFYAWTEVWLEQ